MTLATNAASLFSNIPDTDALHFGMGDEFKPELVSKWLERPRSRGRTPAGNRHHHQPGREDL